MLDLFNPNQQTDFGELCNSTFPHSQNPSAATPVQLHLHLHLHLPSGPGAALHPPQPQHRPPLPLRLLLPLLPLLLPKVTHFTKLFGKCISPVPDLSADSPPATRRPATGTVGSTRASTAGRAPPPWSRSTEMPECAQVRRGPHQGVRSGPPPRPWARD